MNGRMLAQRVAVCSWSLQPQNPRQLISDLKTLGIPRVQLALDPLRTDSAVWGEWAELATREGITTVSGMFGTVGEDYSTLATIRRTGGVVPDATWEENWVNIQAIAKIAAGLGLKLVTFHAGFLPHEESDPAYQKLLQRIERIADLFAAKGVDLAFETGQERAETLAGFLKRLNKTTVGVNFDPANMILYDKGNPIQALETLMPWLKQCHIKDAIRTKVPGTWGEEVVTGTGEVDWKSFLGVLGRNNFAGHLAIEREAGQQRREDILAARNYLEQACASM